MIGSTVGGLMALKEIKKYEGKANEAYGKAIKEFENMGIPNVDAQKIILENPQLVFQYDPELEEVYNQQPSLMKDIITNDLSQQAQFRALDSLQQMGEEGLTTADKAELRQIRNSVASEAKARDESILQNMAQRGVKGAGEELASRMMSSQQSAQRASEEGDRMAKMAFERALQSTAQAGQMGGQIRSQEFGEESQKAQAQDVINAFNTQNRQQVGARNVASKNEAQLQTEQLKQNLETKRSDTANIQEQFNKGLLQQDFENQMGLSSAKAKLYAGDAERQERIGAQKAAMHAGIGKSASQTGTSGLGAFSDERMKKDIHSGNESLSDFLNTIEAKEYGYIDKRHGAGRYVSPMAQDLEKTDLGKDMVENTPKGKKVDYAKGFGTMLAAQSFLHKKIEQIERSIAKNRQKNGK